jgi:hypothetical protein
MMTPLSYLGSTCPGLNIVNLFEHLCLALVILQDGLHVFHEHLKLASLCIAMMNLSKIDQIEFNGV